MKREEVGMRKERRIKIEVMMMRRDNVRVEWVCI